MSDLEQENLEKKREYILNDIMNAQKTINALEMNLYKVDKVLFKVYSVGDDPNNIVEEQKDIISHTFIDDFALINNVFSFGSFAVYTISSAALMGYSIYAGDPVTIGISSSLLVYM